MRSWRKPRGLFPQPCARQGREDVCPGCPDIFHPLGYAPVECASEEEAKDRAADLIPRRQWPCYFFASDTTGEKEFEEFYAEHEDVVVSRFSRIGVVRQREDADAAAIESFLAFAKRAKTDPRCTKADYVREILKVVPTLQHEEKGKSLDQKM